LGEGGKFLEASDADGEKAAVKLIPKLPGADRELHIAHDLTGRPNLVPIPDLGLPKSTHRTPCHRRGRFDSLRYRT
jgi:hypothetical protein